MGKRKSSRGSAAPAAEVACGLSRRESLGVGLLQAGAALLGALLVWAFLAPMDATSVFLGAALPQNLFWLLAAVLCGGAASCLGGIPFSRLAWAASLAGLGWLVLLTLLAGNQHDARTGWNGFWQVIALAGCYVCARRILLGPQTRAAGLLLILTGCVAVSAHGIYQVAVEMPATRARYEADPDAEIARIESLYAPPGSPQRARYEARLYSPEPYAAYALANSLATTLSAGLVLCLALGLARLTRPGDHQNATSVPDWLTVGSLVLGTALIFGVWMLTRSRSAYLAVLAAIGCGLMLTPRVRERLGTRSLAIGLCVVGAIGVAALGWLLQVDPQVLSDAPKSIAFRLEYWQATLRIIADHPLLGIGLGNFQATYPQYKLPIASEEIADPHNWILDLAVTLSLPITVLVLGWLARLLLGKWQAGEQRAAVDTAVPEALDRRLSRALLLGAGVGGPVCALLMNLLQNHQLLGGVLLGWSIAALLSWGLLPLLREASPVLPQASLIAALAMLLCLLATGSWQATGIAVPCLLLLAASTGPACVPSHCQTAVSLAPAAIALAGLVAFIIQAWRPVTTAWQFEQQAQVARNWSEQQTALVSASEADPWDSKYLAMLAQAEVQTALQAAPDAVAWRATRECFPQIDRWLSHDPQRFTNWRQAGHLTLQLVAASQRSGQAPTEMLARAVAYYQGAVDRYPTSPELRLQLAAVAAFAGNRELYASELQEAMRLSELTPHADKKLENQLIWLPLEEIPPSLRLAGREEVPAEPLIEWLRSEETRFFGADASPKAPNEAS